MSSANLIFANQTSNSIVDEVTNEVLIDLMNYNNRHDFMSLLDQAMEDYSILSNNNNNHENCSSSTIPCTIISQQQPVEEYETMKLSSSSPSDMITLDESYIHQLIDLELRNVPSSLGLVWSKLSSTNEFQFNTRIINNNSTSSSPTTESTCSNSNRLFNSFSSNNENQYTTTTNSGATYSPLLGIAGSNVWEPSSTPIATSVPDSSSFVILPSLENSQQPDLHHHCNNGMQLLNGSSYTSSPSKITKKQNKMKTSSPMKKKQQLVSNNDDLSYCISFHQPESSFSNFTSYNDNKKVPKKRRSSSSSNNNMPNYRVRFSHNKFEEIEFKKSNPKGKFIIFK